MRGVSGMRLDWELRFSPSYQNPMTHAVFADRMLKEAELYCHFACFKPCAQRGTRKIAASAASPLRCDRVFRPDAAALFRDWAPEASVAHPC